MKKYLLFILTILLLTGCSANYTIKKNVKKECKKYEEILTTSYGGGEGEHSGVVQYGYCDGHFIQSEADKDSVIKFSYDYTKTDYNDIHYKEFKGNLNDTLVMTSSYSTKVKAIEVDTLRVDYVIEKDNVVNVINHIENNILPLIGSTIKEDNIYITIYIKNKTMKELETLKSYILMTDYRWNEKTTNLILGGKIIGEAYKDSIEKGDTKENLKISINSFKSFYAG